MNASLFLLTVASLAAAPQDVLYDFYSTSCGPCQMMMPIVQSLHAQGYPVQTVDVDQRPDLAQRFGIQQIPAFVLVIGGRERERLIGVQEESTLRGLLAQIPYRRTAPAQVADSSAPPRPRRSVPVRLADDDSQGSKWNFHLPLPSFAGRTQRQDVQIDPPSQSAGARAQVASDAPTMKETLADATPQEAAAPNGATAGDESPRGDRPTGEPQPDAPSPAQSKAAKMLASSVRIRVKDANGVYFGSGVVIDSHQDKTLVLTCGHILRDVKEESRIEVDVFDGKRSRTYAGSIVKYDLEADLGLIAVATRSAVTVSPIASLEGSVRKGDPVVSIGCSQGEVPSVERLHVTMLNRYVGPDTIECTGVPGQGRSGGGLFTTHGSVVGICTNADPRDRRGVYAGLKPIHELLHTAGLDDLIPMVPRARRDSLAEATAVKTEPVADDPRAAKAERSPEDTLPQSARGASAKAGEALAAQTADEGEITPKMLEQSEVICIIRPVNQPHGKSRVVIINRASRKFMGYLTGEMKDQLMPAMAHSRRNDAESVTSNDAPRGTVAGNTVSGAADANDSPRTTAAWKPTAR